MSFVSLDKFQTVFGMIDLFGRGIVYTIILSLCAVIIGFVLALLLAFMRLSKNKLLRFISGAYVEIVRGTPLMVQLFIVFSVVTIPSIRIFGFMDTSRFIPGVIAMSLNSGGYVAEIIRGGIEGVDYGQNEAARSLGMSRMQTMRTIILPQAIKNILPAIANEFVTIIKESSVCTVLGMGELMFAAKQIGSTTYCYTEAYIVAAMFYFCLTFPTSKAIGAIERRMRRGDQR